MKLAIKLAIAGTALVAGVANAANIANGGTVAGGSDLVLFISDTTHPNFYLKDLGVQMDSLGITKAQTASDPDFNLTTGTPGSFTTPQSLGFTADAGIAGFISAHTGDTLVYSILATDVTGTNNNAGSRRIVGSFTDGQSPLQVDADSAQTSTAAIGANGWFAALNAAGITFPNTTNGYGAGTGNGANAPTFFSAFTNGSTVGDTMTLWEIATHGAGNEANVYESSTTLKLTADGTLTVGVSSVPLPAAVWLLGSGLLGLCGVGRRRAA